MKLSKETLNEISDFFDGIDSKIKSAQRVLKKSSSLLGFSGEPTEAQINSACLSRNHSFGLMSKEEQDKLRNEAKEWFHAWMKEFK